MRNGAAQRVELDLFTASAGSPARANDTEVGPGRAKRPSDASDNLGFALKWHDEGLFRIWLLSLRKKSAVGRSFVTFLESASEHRQPSRAYSALKLLRAAVLATWILPRKSLGSFNPLNDDDLSSHVYELNAESESLRQYLGSKKAA